MMKSKLSLVTYHSNPYANLTQVNVFLYISFLHFLLTHTCYNLYLATVPKH